eukprot:12427494-Karenia_brevis.AAC.1
MQLGRGKIIPSIANQSGRPIERGKGVAQGRSQSMLQFVVSLVVSLSGLIGRWKGRGWGYTFPLCTWLGLMDYADDIILFSTSLLQLQTMIDELQETLASIGLRIASKRDKVSWTIFPLSEDLQTAVNDCESSGIEGFGDLPVLVCAGSPIPISSCFKVCKLMYCGDGSLEREAMRRAGVASASFAGAKGELTNKKASHSKRCHLLNVCVGSAMLWASEVIPPSRKFLAIIGSHFNSLAFKMLGKKWGDGCDALEVFVEGRKQAKKALQHTPSGDAVKQILMRYFRFAGR